MVQNKLMSKLPHLEVARPVLCARDPGAGAVRGGAGRAGAPEERVDIVPGPPKHLHHQWVFGRWGQGDPGGWVTNV